VDGQKHNEKVDLNSEFWSTLCILATQNKTSTKVRIRK